MANFGIYGQLAQYGDPAGFTVVGTLPQYTGEIEINRLDFSISGTLKQYAGAIEVIEDTFFEVAGTLPQYTGSVSMLHNHAFSVAGTFKQYTGNIAVSHGKLFTVAGTLKQYTGNIEMQTSSDFAVAGTFKQYFGFIEFAGAFTAICMNPLHRGVTEYTNYGFNSLIEHGGVYYGIKSDGIYLLEGTTDNGTAIAANLQTGLMDFGTARGKGISNVYVGAELNGTASITAITDGNVEKFTRTITGTSATGPVHKRLRLPYSHLSRYWGVKIANTTGAQIGIDSVEIETGTMQSY